MEVIDIKDLKDETVTIILPSLQAETNWYTKDGKSYVRECNIHGISFKDLIASYGLFQKVRMDMSNTRKYYCIIIKENKLYITKFGKRIYDIVKRKLEELNETHIPTLLSLTVKYEMKEIPNFSHLPDYSETIADVVDIVDKANYDIENIQKEYKKSEGEIDKVVKKVKAWHDDENVIKYLESNGVELVEILKKKRRDKIDNILKDE